MKGLTRVTRRELSGLQEEVRRLAAERDAALRRFMAARISTTRSAQVEFWLEFVWLNQEYRYAVHHLASFCADIERPRRRATRERHTNV